MTSFGEQLESLIWSQFWQVTAVILLTLAVTGLACRTRPHLAYLLWVVVLLKCLTPPLWSSPTSLFSWITRETALPMRSPPLAIVGEPNPTAEAVNPPRIPPEPSLQRTREVTTDASSSLIEAVILTWLGVAVFVTALYCRYWRRWSRIAREARNPSPELTLAFDSLLKALAVRRSVRLRITPESMGPFVVGVWRPVVVVPSQFELAMSPQELRVVLAHEATHLQRGDTMLAWLQLAVQIVWWFHPLVWLANRQMNRVRELACDESTIASLGLAPKRYVEALVRAVELNALSRAFPPAIGMRTVDITKQRLEYIMQRQTAGFTRCPSSAAWIAATVMACLLLPGASLAWQVESSEDPVPAANAPVSPSEYSLAHREAIKKIRALGGMVETMPGPNGKRVLADLTQWTGTVEQIGLLQELDQLDYVEVHTIYRLSNDGTQPPDPPATAFVTDEWLAAVAKLPSVSRIGIGMAGDYTATGLAQLRSMPNLRSLSLTDVTDEQLQGVGELSSLQTVWVEGPKVSDEGLHIFARLPELQNLWVLCPRVSGSFLAAIKPCQKLRMLSLKSDASPPQLEGLRAFPNLKKVTIGERCDDSSLVALADLPLVELGLKGDFTDASLLHLKTMPQLRSLALESPLLTGNGLSEISNFSDLRRLGISSARIRDSDLERLTPLKQLEEISLIGTSVTEQRLATLRQLFPSLKEPEDGASFFLAEPATEAKDDALERIAALGGHVVQSPQKKDVNIAYLNNWTGTAEDLELLKKVRNLEEVQTTVVFAIVPPGRTPKPSIQRRGSSMVTDEWLAKLAELPDLKSLHISDQAAYTAAGIEALSDAPHLESLWLDHLEDTALAGIAKLTQLQDLSISNSEISDSGLAQLRPLTRLRRLSLGSRKLTGDCLRNFDCPELEELELSYTSLNDASMSYLPRFAKLRRFSANQTKITDVGIEHLAGLKELVDLRIDDNAISDEGVKHLTGLRKMRYLSLGNTDITGASLAGLGQMTDLRVLNLHGTAVSDEDLVHLKNLKELFAVALSGTQVTKSGVARLHEWLPQTKQFPSGITE